MQYKLFLYLILAFCSLTLHAQHKTYSAIRLKVEEPRVDGKFDDEAWADIPWEGDFVQFNPDNGGEPSQKTAFKLTYDDANIYVAIKNYDTEPDKIEKRLTRRDGFDGDLCGIHFDSYFDRRTAFVFLVSASGVKNDGIFTNDGQRYDESLDPIWFVKTKIVADGWNAEMKIPLSQLRFGKGRELRWGMQVLRSLFRKDELSIWQFISQDESGWISKYGDLTGLNKLRPKKQIELAPFALSKIEKYKKEESNPFADGLDMGLDAGIDAKIGITNDLILDIAINPDFGQVEADPSEVNLTAFETFFEEKRPFFIEGTSITNYSITSGGSPWSRDNLFYSRRIGRQPQYYPEIQSGEYIKFPQNSRILGAIKLTGKTKNGWSIGVMESLVNKQYAKIDLDGKQRDVAVVPLSNFFLTRVQKDINKGNTIIGGMLTATNRKIKEGYFNFLPEAAYSGGIDIIQYFKEKKYFVSSILVASGLYGDREAITAQQLSPRRYFQRPDAAYLTLDTTKTALLGHGGTFKIGKSANSGLRFIVNLTWRSPGLELNDLGYLRYSDNIFHFIWVSYKFIQPFKGVREMQFNANEWMGWDFGGTNLFKGINFSTRFQFDNFWRFRSSMTKEFAEISNIELRGGESIRKPGGGKFNINFSSNTTLKFRLEGGYRTEWGDDDSGGSNNFWGEISYRPINTLSIKINPSFNISRAKLQYVNTFSGEGTTYLFAELKQKVFNLTLRLDYNITPDFTIQYYASPFIASGLYDEYKKITDTKAEAYADRFSVYDNTQILHYIDSGSDLDYFGIDENGDMNPEHWFNNQDFNFKQFRSNLVARWEYTPGSVVFIVWAQGRTAYTVDGSFDYSRDIRDLFSITPDDVFLVKLSHRFRLEN